MLLVGTQVLFMELIYPIPKHVGVACLIPWPKLLEYLETAFLLNLGG
jgi:hypothetical protein